MKGHKRLSIFLPDKDKKEIFNIKNKYKNKGLKITLKEAFEIWAITKNKGIKSRANIKKDNEKIFKIF